MGGERLEQSRADPVEARKCSSQDDLSFFLTHTVRAIRATAFIIGIGYDYYDCCSQLASGSSDLGRFLTMPLREISEMLEEIDRIEDLGSGNDTSVVLMKEAGVNLIKKC